MFVTLYKCCVAQVVRSLFSPRRQHHHVRSAAALRVRVRPHRCHFLHLPHPDWTADGGPHHSDVALAHDRRRAPELGLLRRLTRLPARVHRWVSTNTNSYFSHAEGDSEPTAAYFTETIKQIHFTAACLMLLCFCWPWNSTSALSSKEDLLVHIMPLVYNKQWYAGY